MNHEIHDQVRVDWRDARRRRSSRHRAAFTFLELLISLSILLVAIGIVAPSYYQRFKKSRFRDATVQVESFFSLARAESLRRAELVEVSWDRENRQLVQQAFQFQGDNDARAGSGSFDSVDNRSILDTQPHARSALDDTPAPHEVIRLPDEVDLVFRLPQLDEDDSDWMNDGEDDDGAMREPEALRVPGSDDSAQTAPPVRLAVFMPDGSVLAFRAFWLTDSDGRRARYTVNTWTGLLDPVRIELVSPFDEAGSSDADSDTPTRRDPSPTEPEISR